MNGVITSPSVLITLNKSVINIRLIKIISETSELSSDSQTLKFSYQRFRQHDGFKFLVGWIFLADGSKLTLLYCAIEKTTHMRDIMNIRWWKFTIATCKSENFKTPLNRQIIKFMDIIKQEIFNIATTKQLFTIMLQTFSYPLVIQFSSNSLSFILTQTYYMTNKRINFIIAKFCI